MATALITGASSGIGAAAAKVFARQGYDLLLLGRDQERLEKTKKACSGVIVETLAQDLNQLDKNVLLEKLKNLPPLTVLINNAGIYQQAPVQGDLKIWEKIFQTNLLASIKITQICWDIFVKNKQGSIVNVSSTLGVKPISGTSAYSAMKAAMNNWTLTLAQEGAEFNIRANCICPGLIDTPIHSEKTMQMVKQNLSQIQLLSNVGTAEDVAESILFLASEKSKFTTGAILHVDGGTSLK